MGIHWGRKNPRYSLHTFRASSKTRLPPIRGSPLLGRRWRSTDSTGVLKYFKSMRPWVVENPVDLISAAAILCCVLRVRTANLQLSCEQTEKTQLSMIDSSQACFDDLDVSDEADHEDEFCVSFTGPSSVSTNTSGACKSVQSIGVPQVSLHVELRVTSVTKSNHELDGTGQQSTAFISNACNTATSQQTSKIGPVDFGFLLKRCDNDDQLALEVYRHFCIQGPVHLRLMQSSCQEMDNNAIMFHAVRSSCSQDAMTSMTCIACRTSLQSQHPILVPHFSHSTHKPSTLLPNANPPPTSPVSS